MRALGSSRLSPCWAPASHGTWFRDARVLGHICPVCLSSCPSFPPTTPNHWSEPPFAQSLHSGRFWGLQPSSPNPPLHLHRHVRALPHSSPHPVAPRTCMVCLHWSLLLRHELFLVCLDQFSRSRPPLSDSHLQASSLSPRGWAPEGAPHRAPTRSQG